MTRFADIQARHAKATPGPWAYDQHEDEWNLGYVVDESGTPFSGRIEVDEGMVVEPVASGRHGRDADFIAHCPDDIRWLLDRVTQLETALRELDALEWREEVDMGGEYVTTKDRPYMDEVVGKIARAALDTEQT